MGAMFFANPVVALRNIRAALRPGGRLCAVVWRRKLDSSWVWEAEQVVEACLDHPEETDEPTCCPGPFSTANADPVGEQLAIAGFESIELLRSDVPLRMGVTLDDAVELTMALGPAGEVLRLWGDRRGDPPEDRERDPRRPRAVRDGGRCPRPSSPWVISAVAPGR